MEFEALSEEVEWEVRRVAAAFGVVEWTQEFYRGDFVSLANFKGCLGDSLVEWDINLVQTQIDNIQIGCWKEGGDGCSISYGVSGPWVCEPNSKYDGLMARGLYRLGFEDESVLCQLPPLSAHEKLELRLSLPREFWPQKWLDEEAANY